MKAVHLSYMGEFRVSKFKDCDGLLSWDETS